ncbi:hypothetical protein [Fluviispira multicolorata]|uniref:Uncharacterized protein n=1 Tax=Fluviispira multicolorata TaxID=2654512 RepID=A0A833JHM1_9BACT|nr:hypothetical protein [Fluviispira multicolorata]KAB8033583.1 hypothetical protein GCL57_02425 [Fluviispira multicolorata]
MKIKFKFYISFFLKKVPIFILNAFFVKSVIAIPQYHCQQEINAEEIRANAKEKFTRIDSETSEPKEFYKYVPNSIDSSHFKIFPLTSQKIVNKSEIPEIFLHEKSLMENAIRSESGLSIAGEIFGPIGNTAMVLLWGVNIINSFTSETDTGYDKSCAVLGIVPIVGDVICLTRDVVDAKIFHARSNKLIKNGYYNYVENASSQDQDLMEAQKKWEIAINNFYGKHVPLLARSIVEDVIIKYNNAHKWQVASQTRNLDNIFNNLDFELNKSLNNDLLAEQYPLGQQVFYGSTEDVCKISRDDLIETKQYINYVKCEYNKIIFPHINGLILDLKKKKNENFNSNIATEYFDLHKVAVASSMEKISWIKDKELIISQIKNESKERLLEIKRSKWINEVGEYAYQNMSELAFKSWVLSVFNREASRLEIFNKKVKVIDKMEKCSGTILFSCKEYPEEYEVFDENKDVHLFRLKSLIENVMNESIDNLDNLIELIISGQDLKNSSWMRMQNESIEYFIESRKIEVKIDFIIKKFESLYDLTQANTNKSLWKKNELHENGIPTTKLGKIDFKSVDLILLKHFMEKKASLYRGLNRYSEPYFSAYNIYSNRDALVDDIKKILNKNIDLYYKQKFTIQHPYFSDYPAILFDLKIHSPIIYNALVNASLKSINLKETLLKTIKDEYEIWKEDDLKLYKNIGDFSRIAMFHRSILPINGHNGENSNIFFSDSLPQKYMYFDSINHEAFFITELYEFYDNSDIMSQKLAGVLNLISMEYNKLNDHLNENSENDLRQFCFIQFSTGKWLLHSFEIENKNKYKYFPHFENYFNSIINSMEKLDHNVKFIQSKVCNDMQTNQFFENKDATSYDFALREEN